MPVPESPVGRPRPLRADAAHNRQQIVDAARQAFAERGLGVRLDEIADAAGVGVGTVYRRFKDKDELIRVLFERSMNEVIALADRVLAEDDDGSGLRRFLDQAFRLMAADRGLQQILTGAPGAAHHAFDAGRAQIEPRVAALAVNARAAGRLRADLDHLDLPVIQIMVSAAMGATTPTRGDLWERYVALLLDALEPHPGDRELPGLAPTAPEVATILEHWRRMSA
jgi:AcrR family transcriptional regulator